MAWMIILFNIKSDHTALWNDIYVHSTTEKRDQINELPNMYVY